eukprot:Rhum_TRINITY_DN18518_c0_g1::Rhum_TRINITY_DN18518_c0_g1_i1::g.167694::m.167694
MFWVVVLIVAGQLGLLRALGELHQSRVVHRQTNHGLTQALRRVRHLLGVLVVRAGLNDRTGPLLRVARGEDARADEHAVAAELHHERHVSRRGQTARGERHHRQAAELLHLLHQLDGRLDVLGVREQLVVVHRGHTAALTLDRAAVAHSLDDVAGAGLALHADHLGTLGDAAQGLTQVAGTAHERHLEGVLVDVVLLVRHRQHLGLVNVVHAQLLQDLSLGEVTDAGLGHDRDRDRVHDALDHERVAHARHATVPADVGRDALQRHDGARAGGLSDLGLGRGRDVHDDTALHHRGHSALHLRRAGHTSLGSRHFIESCVDG